MKNLLTALWNGQLCPFDECSHTDAKTREINHCIDQHRTILTQSMNADQLQTLEKLEDSMYELVNHSMEKSFLKGIETALGFIIEALR